MPLAIVAILQHLLNDSVVFDHPLWILVNVLVAVVVVAAARIAPLQYHLVEYWVEAAFVLPRAIEASIVASLVALFLEFPVA